MGLLPSGIYFETYNERKAYIHTKPQWAWFILFLLLLVVLPYLVNLRFLGFISTTYIILIAVVGLQIITGYAGQINLGQSAFMGMGAYVTASLALNLHLPIWITIPCGGIGGAILGVIFGLPVLRIKGFYAGLSTLAGQIVFPLIIFSLPLRMFGGALGLRIEPARFLGITFDSDVSLYYFNLIISMIMVFFAFNLVRSRISRAFVAVRDNDIVAELIGINISYYKILAFFIGAFYAGVAGSLWAYNLRYVGVDQFTLFFSIWYLGMIIVGGTGNLFGAILGTLFLRSIQEVMNHLGPFLVRAFPKIGGPEAWFGGMNILLGLLIVLFLIYEPRGLAHVWNTLKLSYRIWPFPYTK